MSIGTVRDDYVTLFTSALSGVTGMTVVEHDGRFDINELRRWTQRLPIAVIALLGMGPTPDELALPQQVVTRLRWGLFIVTQGTTTATRGDDCLTILQTALTAIRLKRDWTDSATRQITGVRADSLYGGEIDKQGVAIWAASWEQDYELYTP